MLFFFLCVYRTERISPVTFTTSERKRQSGNDKWNAFRYTNIEKLQY